MEFLEKLAMLDYEDYFSLFLRLGVEPKELYTNGKHTIQMVGLCHHGEGHSALFDSETLMVYCFSECGRARLVHNWIAAVLNISGEEALYLIDRWVEEEDIDLSAKERRSLDFSFKGHEYEPKIIEEVKPMPQAALEEIVQKCDCSFETLNKLVWHREDGIEPEILKLYNVMYMPSSGSIILPHHNKSGGIVGLYERSFKPLRRIVKKENPELPWWELIKYPRAKYVPLLRDEKYMDEEHKKNSWSFPNSFNLYGLHLAKEEIQKRGQAIIFEGGKSVMLARQYGYPNSVASHTFGAHMNHISMLIECGAKEIILAFDKQYEVEFGPQWDLFEKKTRSLAEKVGRYVKVSRLVDRESLVGYKDAPIDRGKENFDRIFQNKECLNEKEEKERGEVAAVQTDTRYWDGILKFI